MMAANLKQMQKAQQKMFEFDGQFLHFIGCTRNVLESRFLVVS